MGMRLSPIFCILYKENDGCTHKHQNVTEHACETDAHTVEDDSAKEEHEQEYIDESVGSREETVFVSVPTQTVAEHCLQW